MFLKINPENEKSSNMIECPNINRVTISDLQHTLDQEVVKLSKRQEEEQNSINNLQAQETENMINSIHNNPNESSYGVKDQNLLQFDGSNAINDFGKFLNLKVGPPTIANSIANTESIAKSKAENNSLVNTVQNVKSTTNADAEGERNSIAVSNVVGNTQTNSQNLAVDNSRAINVMDNVNNGNSTAKASENSLAASSVKADQKSDTNTVAVDNSTTIGTSKMTTNAQSTANAVQGSIADTKTITNEKSTTNTLAANNSTAIGVTTVNTEATSTADASNQSLAQSLAQSQNTANTNTVALDNSAAIGASNVNSTSNSTAMAINGGNALCVADAKSNLATDSVANNSSATNVTNNGGSESNATSVSKGIAAPYQNPLETPISSNQNEQVPAGLIPSSASLQATGPIEDKVPSKMPLICDEIPKTFASETKGGSQDIIDKVMSQVDKCGTSEVAKETIKAATNSDQIAANDRTVDLEAGKDRKITCGTEEKFPDLRTPRETINLAPEIKDRKESDLIAGEEKNIVSFNDSKQKSCLKKEEAEKQREEDKEQTTRRDEEEKEKEKLRAERERLKEENRKLRKEREEALANAKTLRKEEERRKRKERKERDRKHRKVCKKRNDRLIDIDYDNVCAPSLHESPDNVRFEISETPKIKYDSDCEINEKIAKDFDEGIKDSNVANDPKFADSVIFEDKITEFDTRRNDAKVLAECQNICKKENLGNFVDSQIQDIISGKFLFKCRCSNGVTDWFLFDEKNQKSKAFGSSTQNLLDDEEEDKICTDQAPALTASTADQNQTVKIPKQVTAEAEKPSEDDSDDDSDDETSTSGNMPKDLGDCFNFFIDNKFKKLHNRLNKMKAKNTNYISEIQQRQKKRQASKATEMVDNTADGVRGTEAATGSACDSVGTAARFKNIQCNLSDIKQQLDVKKCAKDTPEDLYFKDRNAKDEDKFNKRIQSRFEEKKKSEDNRFTNRFSNVNRYAARDRDANCEKKPAIRAAESKTYIADEVGKIKKQNQDYLSRIKSIFGEKETKIDSC